MELREYLTQNKITMQKCGESVGRAQSIISRLCAHRHWPDRSTAVRLVKFTKGRVTLSDLYQLPSKLRCKCESAGH